MAPARPARRASPRCSRSNAASLAALGGGTGKKRRRDTGPSRQEVERERLEQASQELQRSDGVWLTERRAWIERAETMLQREPGWQDQVREAIARRDDTVSQEYLDTYAHNLEVIHAAIADVIESRSEKQDRRLRRELQDLRADLQTLIDQGEAAPAT